MIFWYEVSSSLQRPPVASELPGFLLAGTSRYVGQAYFQNVMTTSGADGAPAASEIDGLEGTVDPEVAPAGPARAASQKTTTAMTPKAVRPRERMEVRKTTFPDPGVPCLGRPRSSRASSVALRR